MADKNPKTPVPQVGTLPSDSKADTKAVEETVSVPAHDSEEESLVRIGWRSWLIVFITSFA